jgi:putative ATP-binding cassette transporter
MGKAAALANCSLPKEALACKDSGEGTIMLPSKEEMMFLPQSPYMPALPLEVNNLREQLLFPWFKPHMEDIPEKTLTETLKLVNLGHLLERHCENGLDTCQMWNQVLSLGEQQRLAMARVLLSEAKVVFLDESTSAMDEANEKRMYDLLREQNIWYVSIGHHKKLANWHDKILLLHTSTEWETITHAQYFGDYHKESE